MKNPQFIYLETYGCAANQNNSEIMKGLIRQSGLELVDNEKIADILIINTCIVKGPTENKIKVRIKELEKLNKPIIVAGCMPEVRKRELSGKNIFLLGINHTKDILKLIRKISQDRGENFLTKQKEIKLNIAKVNKNKLIGITQLSEGCVGNCNYCVVKLVKGNLFSYQESEIIKNIQKDIENRCKEIWLTSQDNAAYGLDSDTNLPTLLKKILEIKGKFKIRLGMMNPNHVLTFLPELIELYQDDKFYKFLHLPVQSGSNKILKAMNRQYTREQFIEIVEKFRKQIPGLILSTDIIVAYPGETEKDFEETKTLLGKVRPDVVNFSRYWPMKGTRAADLVQLDRNIAGKRAAEIQKLHLRISLENNKKLEGKSIKVFVNEQEGTNCLARDENYRLIVIKSQEKLLGKKFMVKITKAESHYLLGEII